MASAPRIPSRSPAAHSATKSELLSEAPWVDAAPIANTALLTRDLRGILRLMFARELTIPNDRHFFLLGPRQVGKSSLIDAQFSAASTLKINLLSASDLVKYSSDFSVLTKEVLKLSSSTSHIFIDEIQKAPELLNEVQLLLDRDVPQKFILTGSSARKLRRANSNMLGGRAWSLSLFPLTLAELGSHLELETLLAFGSLPPIVNERRDEDRAQSLRGYLDTYLEQEIKAEAVTRNLSGFIRFLAVAAQANGEQINFTAIARDTQLGRDSVREYFTVLEDTLIGQFLLPFHHSERKRHKTSPKFYFFDTGVLRGIQRKLTAPLQSGTFEFGNCFETFFINEVIRINSYLRKDWKLSFLRTENDVEVDLIIETPRGEVIGIEIKSKVIPHKTDFYSGFLALRAVHKNAKFICAHTGERPLLVEGVDALPYTEVLNLLRAT
jgi:predicted AAA+ superfamily ATPase